MRRQLVAAALFLAALPEARATIVDDINPTGRAVRVTVVHDGGSLTGLVRVEASVEGKLVVGYGSYKLSPGGSDVVTVGFDGSVESVGTVGIIEDADPVG